MAAWSNGEMTHLIPSLQRELVAACSEGRTRRGRVVDGQCGGGAAALREESRRDEEYSDRLWQTGHYVESLLKMMDAALWLIDWDFVYLDHSQISYHHPNLARFRYLMGCCRARCRERPELLPLLEGSFVYREYEEMKREYAGFGGRRW